MKIVTIIFSFIFLLFSAVLPSHALAIEASLSCSPATGTFSVGDTFTVDYVLDTKTNEVFGANIIATYDSGILEAVGTESTPVTTSINWGQPTINTIDPTLGSIQLDYGNSQRGATVSASIGQITFKTKSAGQAQFNYTFFQQNDNTTPGVAKVWGKQDGENLSNVLTEVNNCIYVVEGATPTPTKTPIIPTSTPIAQPTTSELPRTGSIESTLAFLGIGGILLLIGTATVKASFREGY